MVLFDGMDLCGEEAMLRISRVDRLLVEWRNNWNPRVFDRYGLLSFTIDSLLAKGATTTSKLAK